MNFDLNTILIIILTAVMAYAALKDFLLNRRRHENDLKNLCNVHHSDLQLLNHRVKRIELENAEQSTDDREISKIVAEHDKKIAIFEQDFAEIKLAQKDIMNYQKKMFELIGESNRMMLQFTTNKEP